MERYIKIRSKLRSFFELITVILICLLLAFYFLQLWDAEWRIPFQYSGGDPLHSHQVFKSIIDVGSYLENPLLGAPGKLEYYDFPRTEHVQVLIGQILSWFSSDFALIVNIFFLLTFPLTASIAFAVFRHFGISFIVAMVSSILYAMLPYHFVRNQVHLFLSFYCFVPLSIAMALWIVRRDPFLTRNQKGQLRLTKIGFASIIFCLLIASTGTYYTFFSCFLVLVAGLYAFSQSKSRADLIKAGWIILLLVSFALVNLIPVLRYWDREGRNPEVASRTVVDAELNALKMTGLLLPGAGHRLWSLNRMMRKYPASLMRENQAAYLGIVGVIGFIILLKWMFFPRKDDSQDALKRGLSVFNLSLLLLGLTGGIGPLFAFVLFSQFRAYNRVSIFLGFIALFAIGIVLDQFRARSNRIMTAFLLLGVLVLGLWDQTLTAYAVRKPKQIANFRSDAKFVKQIESMLPAGSMIFQLPYHPFPESDAPHRMWDDDHFRGYLHSSKLRWSYGAIKGREWDAWQSDTAELPLPEFLKTLRAAGFRGLYFDRFGYSRRSTNEDEIYTQLGEPVIVSEDKRLIFFLL